MRLLIICNPVAGDTDKDPIIKNIAYHCLTNNLTTKLYSTTGKNDAEEIIKIVNDFDPDKVLVVGGDGTLLLVAKLLRNKPRPIGIIPAGSANGMAEELNIPLKPEKALDLFLSTDSYKEHDLININDEDFCLHLSDIGINANIVSEYEQDESRGMLTYAKYFLKEVTKRDLKEYTIHANGEKFEWKGVMLVIANARRYGTGAVINEKGKTNDGLFELVLVKEASSLNIVKAAASSLFPSLFNEFDVEVIQTKKAKIELKQEEILQIDGEVIGRVKELQCNILPSSVWIVQGD